MSGRKHCAVWQASGGRRGGLWRSGWKPYGGSEVVLEAVWTRTWTWLSNSVNQTGCNCHGSQGTHTHAMRLCMRLVRDWIRASMCTCACVLTACVGAVCGNVIINGLSLLWLILFIDSADKLLLLWSTINHEKFKKTLWFKPYQTEQKDLNPKDQVDRAGTRLGWDQNVWP